MRVALATVVAAAALAAGAVTNASATTYTCPAKTDLQYVSAGHPHCLSLARRKLIYRALILELRNEGARRGRPCTALDRCPRVYPTVGRKFGVPAWIVQQIAIEGAVSYWPLPPHRP